MKESERIIPAKEHVYLDGPHSRGYEFIFLFKVMWQFFIGIRRLHFENPCITVFGSARFKEDHPYYKAAREFGKRIAQLGFSTYNRWRARHYGSGKPRRFRKRRQLYRLQHCTATRAKRKSIPAQVCNV